MNIITQKILEDIENLPPPLQEEALSFLQFLKYKTNNEVKVQNEVANGSELAKIMAEMANRGSAFSDIKDPSIWQHEIRKDRLLPGRE
ncbi:MAG: DUF2281 domain-containing protein [Methylococcales bacterium]|jgi:hypothetical protein|nr:DUF2281 domain-containing protein [Methylococcales bacterium]MBT7409938.1 DUF2281 domain-containing protein [Methylococcales bacterium]